tara:strand:- start:224 stop:466 length:243 start_codon:yes stop_codon:yes gene_type:complete
MNEITKSQYAALRMGKIPESLPLHIQQDIFAVPNILLTKDDNGCYVECIEIEEFYNAQTGEVRLEFTDLVSRGELIYISH